jgi:hypothetical protein
MSNSWRVQGTEGYHIRAGSKLLVPLRALDSRYPSKLNKGSGIHSVGRPSRRPCQLPGISKLYLIKNQIDRVGNWSFSRVSA